MNKKECSKCHEIIKYKGQINFCCRCGEDLRRTIIHDSEHGKIIIKVYDGIIETTK